ncbi:Hypothetical predicted protein [Cloeon dipterum]|uniref:Uncharacterized protein n=1 Tax=Cloeon dipterum TaxID=197152 RepID=A0A8S1DGX9_9INSE|nr:Hypothetical predicted protein [Cloeon dipterum]
MNVILSQPGRQPPEAEEDDLGKANSRKYSCKWAASFSAHQKSKEPFWYSIFQCANLDTGLKLIIVDDAHKDFARAQWNGSGNCPAKIQPASATAFLPMELAEQTETFKSSLVDPVLPWALK